MTAEQWATLQEVAKHLQVSEETIHRWMDRKSLPGIRAGRVWRFKLSEVDAWLKAGKAASDRDPDKEAHDAS